MIFRNIREICTYSPIMFPDRLSISFGAPSLPFRRQMPYPWQLTRRDFRGPISSSSIILLHLWKIMNNFTRQITNRKTPPPPTTSNITIGLLQLYYIQWPLSIVTLWRCSKPPSPPKQIEVHFTTSNTTMGPFTVYMCRK